MLMSLKILSEVPEEFKIVMTYGLVFLAAVVFVYFGGVTLFNAAMEKQEKNPNVCYERLRRFITPRKLLLRRLTFSLVLGLALFFILLSAGVLNVFIYLPCSCLLGWIGFMLPLWYYQMKNRSRKDAFEKKLLDLTMGLANSMRSGLALPQALEAVSKRIGDPMQEELRTVLREYRLGLDLSDALDRLNSRMPCEDLHLLVTTIKLTTKSGGSLVEVLEKMVDTIRSRTELHERLKNMTAQGRFEALAMSLSPIAAFVLLYFIDPDLMFPLISTLTGWCAIGVVLILITIGYLVIRKIMSIEV